MKKAFLSIPYILFFAAIAANANRGEGEHRLIGIVLILSLVGSVLCIPPLARLGLRYGYAGIAAIGCAFALGIYITPPKLVIRDEGSAKWLVPPMDPDKIAAKLEELQAKQNANHSPEPTAKAAAH